METKCTRQGNISPIPNKQRVHENKNIFSKGAFKRNLFGEPSGDQSPSNFAKQLGESPLKTKSNLLPKETTNQAIKRSENISNKTPVGGKDKKGNVIQYFCLHLYLQSLQW